MIGLSASLTKFGYIKVNGRMDGSLSTLYICGFLSIAIAFRALRVTGRGRTGLIISSVQLTALVLALIWAVCTATGGTWLPPRIYGITDIAWPFSHVFMLIAGCAAWRARVWKGWPVGMMLLVGCALPLAMGAHPLFGDLALVILFSLLTAVPLFAIALRIYPSAELRARNHNESPLPATAR